MDRFWTWLEMSPVDEAKCVGKYYEYYLHTLYAPSVFHILMLLYFYARLLLVWSRYNDSLLYTCSGCTLVIDAVYLSIYKWALCNVVSTNWSMALVIICLGIVVNIPLFRMGQFWVIRMQNSVA